MVAADCESPLRSLVLLGKGLGEGQDLAKSKESKTVLHGEHNQVVENLEILLQSTVESGIDDSAPTWLEVLVVFGQEIQRIRQTQGRSLEQIRLETQVPVYQLEALESGAVDCLPEEIFVRGFLKRICMQLGTEGKVLLAQLPASQSRPQEILADWQQLGRTPSPQVVTLRSVHLYIGYATLMAGAAGGLAWSSQEAAQVSQPALLPQPAQNVYSQVKLNPLQKTSQLTSGVDIAPPEAMMPESSESF